MIRSEFSIFFATDLHGSDKCFRKFINAARFYSVNLLFLGGDLTGKSVVAVWRDWRGHWMAVDEHGRRYSMSDAEARAYTQAAKDSGHYIVDQCPEELAAMGKSEKDALFRRLAGERLRAWLEMAGSKLANSGTVLLAIPGNDDPLEFDSIFAEFPFAHYLDAHVVEIAPAVWVVGLGGSNLTPWHTFREMTDDEISRRLDTTLASVPTGDRTIFHVHVPPFGSGLDTGPVLTRELKVKVGPGGVEMRPLGSSAVRRAVEERQPLLGLFGHIHESRAVTRLGRSVCANPGSQYWSGKLLGFWASVAGNRVVDWRLTEG